MASRYIRRQADCAADAFPHQSNAAGIMVDSDDNKLKLNPNGTVREVVDTVGNFTVTGNVSFTGGTAGVKRGFQLAAASQTLTGAQSGQVIVAVVDGAYTLPAAATAGAGTYFTFVTAVASSGTGVTIILDSADTADFKASATGAAIHKAAGGTITNTGATDVVGDTITLVADGVSNWVMVAQSGIYA